MTTMSIPAGGYGLPRRRVRRRSHEEQARSIRTESMRQHAAAPFRYGAAQ